MEYDAFSSTSTQQLLPCGTCGRNFNPDALQRHTAICVKASQKKRKVFDISKQRAEGTELQQFQKSQKMRGGGRKQPAPTPKKNNWRQQHEEFINAIRSAKGVQKAIETGAPLPPPPPPSLNPDYVQCQYCQRRFNQTAAERHVNFCREQHERLPNKKQPTAAAQQRAAARTQYKAPRMKGQAVTSPPSSGYGGGSYSFKSNTPTRPPGGGTSTGRSGSSRSSASVGQTGSSRYGGGTPNSKTSPSSGHGNPNSEYGGVSGRALRTGRTAETYSDARELSAKQRSGINTKRYPSNGSPTSCYSNGSRSDVSSFENLAPLSHESSDHHDDHPRYGGYGNSTHTGPTSRGGSTGIKNGDLGYHSGDSDSLANKHAGRSSSGIARFCHECGTKYPVVTAKFCCECGIKRMNMT